MKITQDMIEDKATQYIVDEGLIPKFVLLDKTRYEEFNKSFETIEITNNTKSKLTGLNLHSCTLKILSVNIDYDLFEVCR